MTMKTRQLLDECYEKVAMGVWDYLAVGIIPNALTLAVGAVKITVTPQENIVSAPNERIAQLIKRHIPSMAEVSNVFFNS